MNTLIVWDQIYESLKSSFNNELFYLLFNEAKLEVLSNEKIVIQVDPIAFSFFQDESTLNYQKFVHVCRAHLGKDVIINITSSTFNEQPNNINRSMSQEVNTEDSTSTFLNTFANHNQSKLNNNSFSQNIINDDNISFDVDVNSSFNTITNEGEINDILQNTTKKSYIDTNLNRAYSFSNYFYSYENQRIVRACKEIMTRPGDPGVNPAFIYGESGIGKTHLINAFGNELFDKEQNLNIYYTTGPNFRNEYSALFKGGINNINAVDDFKQKYFNLDVLIIDDIQILEGNESSLNEFFSIFESLLQNGKQVIITADKELRAIQFEERLLSRFEAGLLLRLKTPDSDTKKQIFNHYANQKDLKVDEDAIQVFIENSSNVRALLGYINSIHMYFINDDLNSNSFSKMDALEFVNSTTGNIQNYTPIQIITAVAHHFDLEPEDITKKTRKDIFVTARSFSAYFLHMKLKLNYKQISQYIGLSNHTSAMRAIKKIDENHTNSKYKDDFILLSKKLNHKS